PSRPRVPPYCRPLRALPDAQQSRGTGHESVAYENGIGVGTSCPGALHPDDLPLRLAAVLRATPVRQDRPATDRRRAGGLDDGDALLPERPDRRLSLCPSRHPPPAGRGAARAPSPALGRRPCLPAARPSGGLAL